MSAENDSSIATILEGYIPRTEYERTLEALDEAMTELETHRGSAEKHGLRVTELEKIVRGRSARDAYDKVADKLHIDKRFRDHAYKLAEIPADADEADAAAVEAHVQKWLTANPDFVEQAPAAPEKPKTLERNEFDAGRGRAISPGNPRMQVTRKQMADAVWQKQNGEAFNAASKAQMLDIIDD